VGEKSMKNGDFAGLWKMVVEDPRRISVDSSALKKLTDTGVTCVAF
jgi:hypothetical protein